jgi:hypothetical protein
MGLMEGISAERSEAVGGWKERRSVNAARAKPKGPKGPKRDPKRTQMGLLFTCQILQIYQENTRTTDPPPYRPSRSRFFHRFWCFWGVSLQNMYKNTNQNGILQRVCVFPKNQTPCTTAMLQKSAQEPHQKQKTARSMPSCPTLLVIIKRKEPNIYYRELYRNRMCRPYSPLIDGPP